MINRSDVLSALKLFIFVFKSPECDFYVQRQNQTTIKQHKYFTVHTFEKLDFPSRFNHLCLMPEKNTGAQIGENITGAQD